MTNILLEITTKCLNCGNTIAVNSAVNKIWCAGCKGQTTFSEELWSLLLDEIISAANEMHMGEARSTSVEDKTAGTVRVNFKKTDLACSGCKQIITYNENDKIHCDNCGIDINKRAVSKVFIKQGVNFFINEDTYQIEEEKEKSYIINPVEISCNNCGAPLKADGTNRLVNCSFCKTEVMIPDNVWYRLHPSIQIRPWYFAYKATMDQKATQLSFDGISGICCDEEHILYCVGENTDGSHALWAMSPQCELKWMTLIKHDKRWPEYFSQIELLADGNLLLWNEEVHPGLVYDKSNGSFIKELGEIEPKNSEVPRLDFYDFIDFAVDPDGSMVALINQRIMRFSKDGEGIYVWPKSFLDLQDLKPIYKHNNKEPETRDVNDLNSGGIVLPQSLKNKTNTYSFVAKCTIHISKDSSLFILAPFKGNERSEILGGAVLTKFNREGKILYKADLEAYGTEQFPIKTDNEGYAYIVMIDAREEYKNNGRMIRVSPDGKEVKVIAKLPFSATLDSRLAVGGDGTIYTVENGENFRIYNRDGKQIWRNQTAQENDKKTIADKDE
jgi:hypothetical protein